jgi:hypothetical protein
MITTLPDGITVTTYPDPTFNAEAFFGDERARLLPHLPPDPVAQKRWIDMLEGIRFVEPELELAPDDHPFGGVAPDLKIAPSEEAWAGAKVYAPAGDKIHEVFANWTVPQATAPLVQSGFNNRSSVFSTGISIDTGFNMLRAYVASWVHVDNNGGTERSWASGPWFHWGLATWFIPNCPNAHVGDNLSCGLWSPSNKPQPSFATIFLNHTQKQGMTFGIDKTAPAGSGAGVLEGKSAEWTLMAPPRRANDPRSQQIPAFESVTFTGCGALTQNNPQSTITPGSGDIFDMFYVNNPGTTLCQTFPGSSPDSFQVNYEG